MTCECAYTPISTLTVSFTAVSSESSPISAHIYKVRLVATEDCHVRIGETPLTSSALEMLLPANEEGEYFSVVPGQVVAVIRDSNDGDLFITEVV